jgi:lactose/raffinose/galactose permease
VIKPSGDSIYAPFDGTIKFTFSTNHVFGIISDTGLEMIIHVGIGTVNMRGKGFVTHYIDGQKVHAGDLLLTFDRDAIKEAGYDDIVVTFFTQPARIIDYPINSSKQVVHGNKLTTVHFRPLEPSK